MTDVLQMVAVVVSGGLLLLVLELVRRRKLTEEYSFVWIVCSAAVLLLSLCRNILHIAAQALGIFYPPALLILVLVLFVFLVSLYFSVVVSRQRQQIERLVEELALLGADVRKLRESIGTVAARDVMPGPSRDPRQPGEQRRVG
jgi:hypothetical protein